MSNKCLNTTFQCVIYDSNSLALDLMSCCSTMAIYTGNSLGILGKIDIEWRTCVMLTTNLRQVEKDTISFKWAIFCVFRLFSCERSTWSLQKKAVLQMKTDKFNHIKIYYHKILHKTDPTPSVFFSLPAFYIYIFLCVLKVVPSNVLKSIMLCLFLWYALHTKKRLSSW